jgi:hypothetical protein
LQRAIDKKAAITKIIRKQSAEAKKDFKNKGIF